MPVADERLCSKCGLNQACNYNTRRERDKSVSKGNPMATSIPKSQMGEPTWEIASLFPSQGHWTAEDYLRLATNKFRFQPSLTSKQIERVLRESLLINPYQVIRMNRDLQFLSNFDRATWV